MPLTAEQYEQLAGFLGSPPAFVPQPAYDGPERRGAARRPARGPAELRLPAQPSVPGGFARGRGVNVYVQDVSMGGLGLLSGTQVRPDSLVELAMSNGHDDLTLRCRVRHCTVLAVGLYAVGVDVHEFEVKQADPESPAAEAAAAWAGFFTNQRATSSLGLTA